MDQVRVNLTLEKEVWEALDRLIPQRKKSQLVNELLKKEIKNIEDQKEQKILAMAFEEASGDKERLASIREWESLDNEDWD
jgi:metal-responsive CopG/Arc/MetJ family transcriptional regulator